MIFSNNPSQKFKTVLNEILYDIEVNWNTRFEFWVMDISKEDLSIYGIKLVCGIDILSPFPQLDFKMECDSNQDPSRFDLDTFEFKIT